MLNYSIMRFQPQHMKSVLVEAWDAFKVSYGNIIVDSFAKTHLLPLSPPNMITNTQAMVASVQTSSKGINQISEDTVASIQLQVTRTNDPMLIIQAKGRTQQPSIVGLKHGMPSRYHLVTSLLTALLKLVYSPLAHPT